MKNTPAHLLPDACYVCGKTEDDCHGATSPTEPHRFWSNADVDKLLAAEPNNPNADAEVVNGASLRAEAGLPL